MRSEIARYSAWRRKLTPKAGSGTLWMPNSVSHTGSRCGIAPVRPARSSAVVRRDSTPIVTALGLGGRNSGPTFVV